MGILVGIHGLFTRCRFIPKLEYLIIWQLILWLNISFFSSENKSQTKVEVIEKASKKHQEKEIQTENLDGSTTL